MLLSLTKVTPARGRGRPIPLIPSHIALLIGIVSSFSNELSWAAENQSSERSASILSAKSLLQTTVWGDVAARHQLDPYVLYAVALIESKNHHQKNQVTPWPWALNHAGKAIITTNKQDAIIQLKQLLKEGNRNVDIGIMQVNLRWHGHRVDKPEQLLDPTTNLEIGAELLAKAIQSSPDNFALGVGRYYNWKNIPAAIEYGQNVINLAAHIRTII